MIKKEIFLKQIRETLSANADTKRVTLMERFFKEGENAKVYGLNAANAKKIAKEALQQVKELSKQEIFEICEELWKSSYLEEAGIACTFAESLQKKYEPSDIVVFEHWLNSYVNNWAACDVFCGHTIGSFVMIYPNHIATLKQWAKSSNRWVRRGAAVSLIIPARKGLFLNDILEIADTLLLDNDDLVQKGYGWMLKAASMSESFVKGDAETKKQHLDAVFNFVMKNKAIMPRTALRYAIEKMPAHLKSEAMKK